MTSNTDPVAEPPSPTAPTSGFYQTAWPFVVATGGEFIGLYFWLAYFDANQYVMATIVLWAGFLIERVVVLNWTAAFRAELAAKHPTAPHYDSFQNMPPLQKLAKLLIITVTEISIWVTAVLVFDNYNWVAALAVLIAGEQLQHSWELGLIASRPIGDYIPTWNALKITLLETIGGIIWIGLVRHEQPQLGGLFLLIGLSIEHVVQAQKIKLDLGAEVARHAAAASHGSGAAMAGAARAGA